MIINNNQYNIGYLCTSRQVENGLGDKIALQLISPDLNQQCFTFLDLDRKTNQFANILKEYGFISGDRLAILLPKCLEQFIAFLGSLKAQVVVVSLFSNLGEDAIIDRLMDSGAKAIITKNSLFRKISKRINQLPHLENIILIDEQTEQSGIIVSYQEEIKFSATRFNCQVTPPDTPSIVHYTSGSTGKPRGVLHVHRSILQINETCKDVLGVTPETLYWCTADQGWITGTSYGIIGPWSIGATQVHFSGAYNAESWFRILQEKRINIWYTAPTALRMLMREDEEKLKSYDLSSLKHISSVGEPLNPEIIHWAKRLFNKDVFDTWFQTETGAIMIANFAGLPVKPGSMGKPVRGIEAAIILEDFQKAERNESGNLCVKSPWPSMFVDYINNSEIYKSKFKKGFYYSGDNAYTDEDGYYWFQGRNDDIINTAGHLVSPFEIESALLELPEIVESAAIAAPDDLLFEKVVVFVVLRGDKINHEELNLKIRLHIAHRVSSVATPQDVLFVKSLPKNKSGKIMRRVLKAQYHGKNAGDTSTLEAEDDSI